MTDKTLSDITLDFPESELAEGKWALKPDAIATRLKELDPDFDASAPASPEAQARMVTRLRSLCGRLPDKRTLKNAVAGQTVQGKSVAGVICKALDLPLDQLETLATRIQDNPPPPEEKPPTPTPEPLATAAPNTKKPRPLKPLALTLGVAIAGLAVWLISNPEADGAAPTPGNPNPAPRTATTPQNPTHFDGKDGQPMTLPPGNSAQAFAAWFKPDPEAIHQRGMILCAGDATRGFDTNFQISWDPKGRIRIGLEHPHRPQTPDKVVVELASPNGSLDPHQWTHVVVMLTPGKDLPVACFLNGQASPLQTTKTHPQNLDLASVTPSFPKPLMLGGHKTVTTWPPLQGQIAGAELFTAPPTQEQIQALMASTRPNF